LKEQEMYPIVETFLKKKGYKTLVKQRFSKAKIRVDIGQDFIELDIIGHKGDIVWIIECKVPCTIEQFGFALGQLICYKFLFERMRKDVKTRYSIALLETEKYPLSEELLETFKSILHSNKLTFGFLKVNENSKEVKELVFA